MLYGNHIRPPPRRRTDLSRILGITYGLQAKGCYTDTQTDIRSYAETMYALLGCTHTLLLCVNIVFRIVEE